MFKLIYKFFDKLEDRVRGSLSHSPVLYSLIGGVSLVLFWQGISVVASSVPFLNTPAGGMVLIFVSVSILLMTGLFVSFFIGDTIIISGINKERKMVDKEEAELVAEFKMMNEMEKKVEEIDDIVKELQAEIHHQHDK
ncbi:MAG: hypothetical protein Q7S19_03705 [bacterium]|nr:hypothetical protein [bacterium]